MNSITIGILVIIILLCLYYVIAYFGNSYFIDKSTKLNPIISIGNGDIESPNSIRYFYEMWLWIDSNSPPDKINTVFNWGDSFVVGLKGSNLSLYTRGGDAKYNTTSGQFVCDGSCSQVLSVTDAFPFQKWVHLVINVDNNTLDAYLDGKLVKSVVSPNPIPIGKGSITVGNTYANGKVTLFRRPPYNITPQEVWNRYMLGNGEGYSVSPYHINVQVLKDDVQKKDVRLF
jgi:hypothetical protein